MTNLTIKWCDYSTFKKPTISSSIQITETIYEDAAKHPAFNRYVEMRIHDCPHTSKDSIPHVTVHLKSESQIRERRHDVGHIFFVDKHKNYNQEVKVWKNNIQDKE